MRILYLSLFLCFGFISVVQAQWHARFGLGSGQSIQALQVGNNHFTKSDGSKASSSFGWDSWLTLEFGRTLAKHWSIDMGFTYLRGANGDFTLSNSVFSQKVRQYSRGYLITPTVTFLFRQPAQRIRPLVGLGPVLSLRPRTFREDNYEVYQSKEYIETAMFFNVGSTWGYLVQAGLQGRLSKRSQFILQLSYRHVFDNQLIEIKNLQSSKGHYTKYTINGVESPESSQECTTCEFGSIINEERIKDGINNSHPFTGIGLTLGYQINF